MSLNNLTSPEWAYSTATPWAANGQVPVDFSTTLTKYLNSMKAPCIDAAYVRFTGNVDVGIGGFPMSQFWQILNSCLINDVGGQRLNLCGQSIRYCLQTDWGHLYQDLPNLSAGAGQTIDVTLPIPLIPQNAARRSDYRIPLPEFIAGGSWSMTAGPAVIGTLTINSGSFQVWFKLVDEGRPELKSRFVLRETLMSVVDTVYPVDGLYRWATAHAGPQAFLAGTTWTAGSTISSRTFNMITVPATLLARDYEYSVPGARVIDPAAAQPSDVTSGFAIPLHAPMRNQPSVEQAQMSNVHFQLNNIGLVAGTPRFIVAAITQRTKVGSALTLRLKNQSDLNAVEGSLGTNTSDGQVKPAVTAAAAYLPARPARTVKKG